MSFSHMVTVPLRTPARPFTHVPSYVAELQSCFWPAIQTIEAGPPLQCFRAASGLQHVGGLVWTERLPVLILIVKVLTVVPG
jgi:hypothetical protein